MSCESEAEGEGELNVLVKPETDDPMLTMNERLCEH